LRRCAVSADSEAGEKPNALEMLKLDPDTFMLEVSRAVSDPRLWVHNPSYDKVQKLWTCRCHKEWTTHRALLTDGAEPCPVPPTLTESPEWWAFRMRDQVYATKGMGLVMAAEDVSGITNNHGRTDAWFAWYSTPFEQIAVCLVALGKWEIGENNDGA